MVEATEYLSKGNRRIAGVEGLRKENSRVMKCKGNRNKA